MIGSVRETRLETDNTIRASIVVPVRNRPDLLESTLKTLVAQDMAPAEYEVIICDDGSTADIEAIAEKFLVGPVRIRVERQPQLGPAAARNLGIRASLSPIVIFIDSDVLLEVSVVRLLLTALDSNAEWMGAEAALHPSGAESGVLWDAPSSVDGGRYHTAAIAYRRQVLFDVGGFDEQFDLPACEDVEIALRVLMKGHIGFVPGAIVWHPKRRVTYVTHWRWLRHWQFETVLALRYGVLAFPGNHCGPFPRFRVALSAVITLPAGRLIEALGSFKREPRDALIAASLAVFDVGCGLVALPSIFFQPPMKRENYLAAVAPVPQGEVAV